MFENPFRGEPRLLAAWEKLSAQATVLSRVLWRRTTTLGQATGREMRTWDVFKWAVIVLLATNLLLILLLYPRTGSEPEISRQDLATLHSEIDEQIAQNRAGATQVILRMRAQLAEEIAKTNAELQALSQKSVKSSPPLQPPMPTPRPRHQ